jgi:hypothetical protein
MSTWPIIRHKACFAPESGCTFELFSGNQGYLELAAKMNYGTLLLRHFLARGRSLWVAPVAEWERPVSGGPHPVRCPGCESLGLTWE